MEYKLDEEEQERINKREKFLIHFDNLPRRKQHILLNDWFSELMMSDKLYIYRDYKDLL